MTIQEKAEKWVNDGDWGNPVDKTGQWMFDKLVEAYKAGYMECTEQLHKPDVSVSVCDHPYEFVGQNEFGLKCSRCKTQLSD